MNHVLFLPSAPSARAQQKHARGALRLAARLAVAIAVVGLGGCGIFGPTTDRRVIGAIDFDHMGWKQEVPETATAGVPIEMTVWTMNGCHFPGETEVAVTGRIAEVTPFDYLRTGDNAVCTYQLYLRHSATVVFPEPGTAEIVLVYSTDLDHRGDGRKVYTVEVSPAG